MQEAVHERPCCNLEQVQTFDELRHERLKTEWQELGGSRTKQVIRQIPQIGEAMPEVNTVEASEADATAGSPLPDNYEG